LIGEIIALLSALSWACGAIIYRKTLIELPLPVVQLIRSVFTAMFLLLVTFALGEFINMFLIDPINLLLIFLGTILGLIIGDTFYFLSLRTVGVSKTVPVSSTYPLFTIFGSYFFLQEPFSLNAILGAVSVIFGIFLLTRKTNEGGINNSKKFRVYAGVASSILAAIFWSSSMIIFDAILYTVSPLAASTWRGLFLVLVLSIIAPTLCGFKIGKIDKNSIILLALAGIIDLGVGGILLYVSIAIIKVAKTTVLTAVLPLFSQLLAVIFLKEKVTPHMLAGTVAIVIGIIIVILG